jgi:hypothetical protein
MDDQDQLILRPEVTVLLETDDALVASNCLNGLTVQKWQGLDTRLAGKPGVFQVTSRFPPGTDRQAYDLSVTKAIAFCKGFIAGWHTRKQ